MTRHIITLYVMAFAALSVALGAAFGQRSDYLRLNAIGAPMNTGDLFHEPYRGANGKPR
jgi:hypothetical protein